MNLANAVDSQLMIPVDDFDRGASFHRDVLGIRFFRGTSPDGSFQCGAVHLLVGVLPAGEKPQRGSAIDFGVSDIEQSSSRSRTRESYSWPSRTW